MTKINNQSQALTSDFVSLVLKGRSDGFTIKGGDATSGKQTTMYDGPRPDRQIAGTCGGGVSDSITLQKCTAGNSKQTWGFEKDGKSIASNGLCIDIENFQSKQGSKIYAYPCSKVSRLQV